MYAHVENRVFVILDIFRQINHKMESIKRKGRYVHNGFPFAELKSEKPKYRQEFFFLVRLDII